MSEFSIVFLVIFCDEITDSKNHSENSLSFSLLKSESVNWCLVCKHQGTEQFDQKSPDLLVFLNKNLLSV